MRLGITLTIVGALAALGLTGALVAASGEGSVELAGLSLTATTAALAASAVASAATASFFLGLRAAVRTRRRLAHQVVVNERAAEAERDARARLLAMRLEQLQREVEALELRRAVALGELDSSTVLIDGDDGDGPVLVVLEDGREPTVLGQRLAEARRTPALPA
jgi:hypothetical protein